MANNKDLRKLNRAELLELLVEQGKEIEQLRTELEAAKQSLAEKEIMLNEAGNIAEAALKINDVFGAAQKAADQYLDSVKVYTTQAEEIFKKREAEVNAKNEAMLAETTEKCTMMESVTKYKCEEMVSKAKAEADVQWQKINKNLDDYMSIHSELKEMFANTGISFERNENN